MPTYYAVLTDVGVTKLAAALATYTPIVFADLAVGDGSGSTITPLSSMTELVNETARVSVNLVEVDPENANQVRVEGLIPAVTGGFTIREAGIFDEDGDMIAVASYPPIYKPVPGDGVSVEEYIRILLVVESAAAVELSVDTSVIVATRLYVDQQILQRDYAEKNFFFRDEFLRAALDTDIWTASSTGGSSDPTIVADSADGGIGAVHPLSAGSGLSSITSVAVQVGTRDFSFASLVRVTDGGDFDTGTIYGNNIIHLSGGGNAVKIFTGATHWYVFANGVATDLGVAWGAAYQHIMVLRKDGVLHVYIDGALLHSEAHSLDMSTAALMARCIQGAANDGSMYCDTLSLWVGR